MKRPNSKMLIERFVKAYLSNGAGKSNFTQLLSELIKDGITDPERIRNYMIIQDYHKYLEKNVGHAGKTLEDLSETYNISTRQVQNIVYKWSNKFRASSNIT